MRLLFWPVVAYGSLSRNVHAAAICAGRQDPAAFWTLHDLLFARQDEAWGAELPFFQELATGAGVDSEVFAACYGGGEAHAQVAALDEARLTRQVYSQPVFEINGGQRIFGSQPLAVFEAAWAVP